MARECLKVTKSPSFVIHLIYVRSRLRFYEFTADFVFPSFFYTCYSCPPPPADFTNLLRNSYFTHFLYISFMPAPGIPQEPRNILRRRRKMIGGVI